MNKIILSLCLFCSLTGISDEGSLFVHSRKKMDQLTFTTTNSPTSYANALVLLIAYDKLGIGLEFKKVSNDQSIQMVNSGRYDGDVKRNESIESKYQNLLKVDVPLYNVEIMSLSRRPTDHKSWQDYQNNSICHLYGMNYVSSKIKEFYRIPVKSFETCFQLVKTKQVDFTFLPRVEGHILNGLHQTDLALSKHVIAKYPSFHYLNRKHVKTAQKIKDILEVMAQSGDIQLINNEAKKAMISKAKEQKVPYCFSYDDACFSILDQIVPKLSQNYQDI